MKMKVTNHKNTNATMTADRDEMFTILEAATKQIEYQIKTANGMGKEIMERQLDEWTNTLEEMRGQ